MAGQRGEGKKWLPDSVKSQAAGSHVMHFPDLFNSWHTPKKGEKKYFQRQESQTAVNSQRKREKKVGDSDRNFCKKALMLFDVETTLSIFKVTSVSSGNVLKAEVGCTSLAAPYLNPLLTSRHHFCESLLERICLHSDRRNCQFG